MDRSPRVILLCPVRDCGAPLARGERAWSCLRGHSFDLAKSGYLNLLQPQDKRSKTPGDSREAVAARRRILAAGHDAPFLEDLRATIAALPLPPNPAILDVGCGEGTHLAALAATFQAEAHGLDLSVPAIDLAARTHPGHTWVVANADRILPYADGSFDLALSLTARRNAPELHRVLSPPGRLLVAVPSEDDLAELREAVLGEKLLRNRVAPTVAAFAPHFELESHHPVRWTIPLEAEEVRDVLASTYRGKRESQRERVEGLGGRRVTMGRDVLVFARSPA